MADKRVRCIITIRESLWQQIKELADSQNRSRPKMIEWILLEQVKGIPTKQARDMADEKLVTEEDE